MGVLTFVLIIGLICIISYLRAIYLTLQALLKDKQR